MKKNRITGQQGEAEIDIYPSLGIDDLGSCVDYLVSEGWWAMKKQSIVAVEFELTATREKLIAHIEKNNLEKELQSITGKCWKEIQEACSFNRKKKYE